MAMERGELAELVIQFTEAFNREDLDGVKLRFHTEDLFVDAAAGKALIRWLCTLETKRGPSGWRGLDILHVENGRITEKLTYAKAKVPLLGEAP